MKKLHINCIFLLLALFCSVTAFAQPDASFSASDVEGCAPLSVQFTSHPSTVNMTHSWTFGNTNGSSAVNPSASYTSPGTYTVTHTVTGSNGSASATKTITVHPTPTVDFTASATTVCPGATVNFTFTGTPGVTGTTHYTWVFGNNATPNTISGNNMNTASAVYPTAGTYNVTLQVTNNKTCFSSLTKQVYITVKEKPVINFTASPKTDFCAGETPTVTFTPSVTGNAPIPYTYNWEFGGPGNPTSISTSPTHTYPGPAPAQYTVKLTVLSSNGCLETITKPNYIRLHDPKVSFTGPAKACVYTTVNFTNTSTPPGAGYTWNFGDGSNSSPIGTHMYKTPGTYTVTLIGSIGGCFDTATRTIEILPQPNPQIVTNPDSLCPAPQLVCFSTQPLMATYDWGIQNENGVNSFTTPNPCVLFGKNGCWPTVLKVTDSNGCKDTILHTLVIHELNIKTRVNNKYEPYPSYSDSGCVPFTGAFTVNIYKGDPLLYPCSDTNRIYPYGIKRVKWKFGNGDSSTAQHPVYTYTDSGHFKVTVEVETNNGCIIRDSLRVKAGYKPIIDSIIASDTVICPKSYVFFTGHVRGYDTLVYWWDFGDYNTARRARDSTYNHFYFGGPPCIDSHTVKLVAYHKGCKSDTFKKEKYIVMLPPCADFDWEIDTCSKPLTVHFYNRSRGDSTWKWDFGDGNTSTDRNPVHTYAVKGYYNVKLMVHNDSTNCHDTMHKRIFFGDNSPDVIANKTELCVGDSVAFWAYQTGDSSSAIFTWYIDGNFVASYQDALTFTFSSPGVYTVMVTSYNLQTKCTDTVTKTDWITVGGPTAGFTSAETHVCRPDTIHFEDTSFAGEGTTLVSRRWFFGTSLSDTARTIDTTIYKYYDTTGDFDVALIVWDNIGCADTVYKQQYAHVLKPEASFIVTSPVCVGAEASFTNSSRNAVSYSWNFGDGGTNTTDRDPKHIYNTMNVFNSQLVVTDSLGCKDTSDIVPVTTTKPIANFTMSDSMAVCAPLIVTFDGRSSIRQRNYAWYFDDGSSPGTKNTHTVVYNNIKEYKVKLVVRDSLGCKDSITKTIQVLGYAGAFDYSPIEGCVPLTVNFSSKIKGNIPTIIWDFGDGNTLLGNYQQPNVSYTYTKPGRYLPRLIFNNGLGCKAGSEGVDTILADDAIADFETGPACQYSVVEFINKSQGVVKPLTITNWTFHDGSFSALNNPKRKYGAPGQYLVKLYVRNANGCEDSVEKDITINTPQEISAGGDTIICLSDSARMMPTGGVSYLWSPGATLSCTNCTNPYAFPKVKTIYTVIGTDVNGCQDTATAVVDLKTHVESIVGQGGAICQGESFTLNVSGARTYVWSPAANLDDYTSANPKASPWETTKYRVIAYEGSCIPDTSNVDLTVHPKPTVSVRGEQTIVAGTSADLLASGQHITRFLWSPAATLSCETCSNPIASPYKTTTYTVKVFTKYECVDSANVTISVLCDESQLFVPNTFTPNGDGVNDIFMVRGTGINKLQSFRVYNRWGQVMFERSNVDVNDKTNGWDGNFNGAQLPPDVYVWTVEAFCENGDLLKLKGDVTIIR
ncbi:MAG TPA: PKD domain-containing protein [Flavipsychrobacter sp.]